LTADLLLAMELLLLLVKYLKIVKKVSGLP
jgi:hypothetical protein